MISTNSKFTLVKPPNVELYNSYYYVQNTIYGPSLKKGLLIWYDWPNVIFIDGEKEEVTDLFLREDEQTIKKYG